MRARLMRRILRAGVGHLCLLGTLLGGCSADQAPTAPGSVAGMGRFSPPVLPAELLERKIPALVAGKRVGRNASARLQEVVLDQAGNVPNWTTGPVSCWGGSSANQLVIRPPSQYAHDASPGTVETQVVAFLAIVFRYDVGAGQFVPVGNTPWFVGEHPDADFPTGHGSYFKLPANTGDPLEPYVPEDEPISVGSPGYYLVAYVLYWFPRGDVGEGVVVVTGSHLNLVGFNGDYCEPPLSGPPALALIRGGLSFPIHLTAPAGDPRLFVVEKGGAIRVFKNGVLLPTAFLDLTGQVSTGDEQGLFSMAFHPGYAINRRFFVSYTNTAGDSRVVEYARSGTNADVANPNPVRTILAVDQPFANHNGGQIAFGPDGKLYVGLGDGGGGGDPQDNAEKLGTLLGKILRIDVDAGTPYVVPPDNPFRGVAGARGEIWDYGLRNPWRFSFDRETGDLYVGDVGQSAIEEVSVTRAGTRGHNFGWDVFEGTQCFEPPAGGCNPSGVTFPVFEYANDAATCSVTGGYVYRGRALPQIRGFYFFSDFCAGWVRSFRWNGAGGITDLRLWSNLAPGASVPSLGEDGFGELYILTTSAVYKIVPS